MHRDEAELARPTRCDGWTITDVLLHLAQTNEAAVASVEGRLGEFASADTAGPIDDVDAWAAQAVAAERDQSPSEVRRRWDHSAMAQQAAFEAADLHARVLWVAGELAARTLATTRLSETWIHTVDVASAFGSRPAPTDRLWHIARLAWRTLPHAFARVGLELQGRVAFALSAPDGDEWSFAPDDPDDVVTIIRGPAVDLCEVAGQRAEAADTALTADGPDGEDVLRLVRTFA